MTRIIVFLGSPGSGKGTQAELLQAKYPAVSHISTGNLLRNEVSQNTTLGIQVKDLIAEGQLVPDDLILAVLEHHLLPLVNQNKTLILDGFPRNLDQAKSLTVLLERIHLHVVRVMFFDIELKDILNRITGRQTCPNCHHVYHIEFMPSQVVGICDVCQTKLIQRTDDSADKAKLRFTIFSQEVSPLLDYYKSNTMHLNASESPDQLFRALEKVMPK